MEPTDGNPLHLGRLIQMLSHQIKRQDYPFEAEKDLTVVQRHVLRFILLESLHRDLYQKDVEEAFQIRRSTATGILQLMERNWYIRRESVARDARLKKIVPTQKAETLRVSLLETMRQMEFKLCLGISEKDLHCCTEVLQQMLQNLSPQCHAVQASKKTKEVYRKSDGQKTLQIAP